MDGQQHRFYSTIGIEGFIIGPPHPLPKEYLNSSSTTIEDQTFTSWEIEGIIKASPEDFVVREVLPRGFEIPGISAKDYEERIRVADISTQVPPPVQNLDVVISKKKEFDKPPKEKQKQPPIEQSKSNVEEIKKSHKDVILDYLGRATSAGDDHQSCRSVPELLESLEKLQQQAVDRIRNYSNPSSDPTNHSSDAFPGNGSHNDRIPHEVWIPPLPSMAGGDDATSSSCDLLLKSERGTFHKAIRQQYPCLKTESAPKRENVDEGVVSTTCRGNKLKTKNEDHWIRISIDDSFNEIASFLLHPEHDLLRLLLFRNRGFEGARMDSMRQQGSNRGKISLNLESKGQNVLGDKTCSVLRLKENISKEDRRNLHQLLTSKNKAFETTTIQLDVNGPNNDPEHCTAVVVRWRQQILMRNQSKRKRKRGDDTDLNSDRKLSDNRLNNLLCVMKKIQKEHLTAIQKLAQCLKCRQTDIATAGIKDLQAVTYQFITLRNMKRRRVEKVNDEQLTRCGISLGLFYTVDFVLNTGELEGNTFNIVLRNLRQIQVGRSKATKTATESRAPCNWAHLQAMFDRVRDHGFINFFGEQRVGAPGPQSLVGARAFDVGKAMLQKDYLKAVHLLIEGTNVRESDEVRRVRQAWKDSGGDASVTLKAFDGLDIMPREKAVLRGLRKYPENPLEALRFLNHSMRTFYIHAYQSYIWNLAASKRIALSSEEVLLGDLYFESSTDERSEVKIIGSSEEVKTVNITQIVLPLPGYNVRFPENEVGNFYKDELQRDKICFDRGAVPESTCKGSYRKLIVVPSAMRLDKLDEEIDCARLAFQLPKGCYATMLLREMMLTTIARCDEDP